MEVLDLTSPALVEDVMTAPPPGLGGSEVVNMINDSDNINKANGDANSDTRFNVDIFDGDDAGGNVTAEVAARLETVAMINHVAYNYVALFIVAIGIFGNLLNIIVLRRPKLKGVMYVYLLGLAVSNLAVLVIAVPAVLSLTAPSCTPNYATAYFYAHLMMPLLNGFMAWSVYIIICMTVNRYISIYMPTYFQRIHTFKNAYVAIFCSFLGTIVQYTVRSVGLQYCKPQL